MIKLLLTLVSIILIVLGVMVALRFEFTIGVLIALAGAINFISRKSTSDKE
jgi:hypothetical protein